MQDNTRKATLQRPEVTIRPAVRALLLYLIIQTVVVVGVFLQVAGFFDSWNGQLVGVLQPPVANPAVYEVVIVGDDNTHVENMPRDVVLGMGLPVLAPGMVPEPADQALLKSTKSRYTFHYLVQKPAEEGADIGAFESHPTTTPQAVGLAVIVWILALAVRNMAYAGSPFWIEREELFLPKAQVQAGSVSQSKDRSRKSAPPPRSRRGPRRR